jgi:hypothetical protein
VSRQLCHSFHSLFNTGVNTPRRLIDLLAPNWLARQNPLFLYYAKRCSATTPFLEMPLEMLLGMLFWTRLSVRGCPAHFLFETLRSAADYTAHFLFETLRSAADYTQRAALLAKPAHSATDSTRSQVLILTFPRSLRSLEPQS